MEYIMICNCMQVSVADIEKALHEGQQFAEVEKQFEKVQMVTHCSTGCGGCHDKVMDIISELMGYSNFTKKHKKEREWAFFFLLCGKNTLQAKKIAV